MKPPRLAMTFLRAFLPRRDAEQILGDLIEEHALRQDAGWFRSQAVRSASPLLWANIRRGGWLRTLGAALAGYFAVLLLVMSGDILMSKFMTGDPTMYSIVSLAGAIPSMLAGGYLAALMRPGAPRLLAVVAGLMGVVSLFATGDQAPLWYQLALIVIGPAGAIAGGRIRA